MKTLKVLLAFSFSFLLSIIGAFTLAPLINISPYPIFGVLAVCSLIPMPKNIFAIALFSAPGGAATPFQWQSTYIPQFISFTNVVALTSLKITTAEDGVLHDYTVGGMIAASGYMMAGVLPANIVLLRLANGQINGRNVTISGVTSAAGVVPFFGFSDHIGKIPYLFKNATITAGNLTTFKSFAALWLPTMATGTDRAEVTYKDGFVQNYTLEDLQRLSGVYQETTAVCINNINAYIDHVDIYTTAATPVYILSYLL